MIKGIQIAFANGEVYTVPPLSLGSIELLQDDLETFTGTVTRESVQTVIKATLWALQRNYPDMTEEKVKNELVDVGNMIDVMRAVMDVGGLMRREQERETGEHKPVQDKGIR